MKLFILFTLFCGIFAKTYQEKLAEEQKKEHGLPTYNSSETYILQCQTYDTTDKTKCATCYAGFQLSSDKKNCTRILTNIPIPPYVSGDKIIHPTIGYDTKENTCTKTIQILNAAGNTEITTDKYYGAQKSCLACSKYTSDNKCEVCANGYLANNGGCTPLEVNPFGQNDIRNTACLHGAYEGTGASKTPKCYACIEGYQIKEGNCIPADNINALQGCHQISYLLTESVNIFNCTECIEGYSLIKTEKEIENGKFIWKCVKSTSSSAEKCVSVNANGICQKCMSGYYVNAGECLECKTMTTQSNYFVNDECDLIHYSNCDCNPNCVLSGENYLSCVSRHCDLFSEYEMSSKHSNYPKCLRCQQGYQLNSDNECEKCKNECFTDSSKTTCVSGYYKSEEGVCRKCEGKCKECISKEICKEGKWSFDNSIGHALNGLPCFDPNCELCDSENPDICYKCKSSSDIYLIGGVCYSKVNLAFRVLGVINTFPACRYYEQPDFITNKSATVNYLYTHFNNIEHAYLRDTNKFTQAGETETQYYCKPHNNLPLYYRNYENNKLTCAGENRDPKNDCECIPGYYSPDIHKYSNCLKTDDPHCVKAISKTLCAKCAEGMVLNNIGTKRKPNYVCGCPNSNQRINSYGVCVDCPKNCLTCETGKDSKGSAFTKCIKCKGEYQYSSEAKELESKNWNRNDTVMCECNDNFVSYSNLQSQENSTTVYSCYQVPRGCKEESKYEINPYSVTCKKCDKDGFTVESTCEACKIAHYGRVNNETKLIDECTICPETEPKNGITYCADCLSGTECSSCIAENLNVTNNCKTCNEGYTMVYRNGSLALGDRYDRMPVCVKCESYCKMDGTNGCFFGEKSADTYDYYKNKVSKKDNYTSDELQKANYVYCDSCQDPNTQDPKKHCACSNDAYLNKDGFCKDCSQNIGNDKFTTLDSDGNKIQSPYSEVCVLSKQENGVNPLCQLNMYTSLAECLVCKNKDRRPSNNCTACIADNTYPVFDKSTSQHICSNCDKKCKTCNNGKTCLSCVAANATGELCDKCIVGNYKDGTDATGSAKCSECPKLCSACESATKCTACAEDNHILGPKNDCRACKSGYYFNVSGSCVQVDVSKGFAESRPVCLDKDGNEIDCENPPQGKTIEKVFEIPTRCDTTKYVGVSPYPANRTCVCAKGYYDNRNATEKLANPIPQCTNIKIVAGDDFCIDGEYDATSKKVVCTKCNNESYLELKNGKCTCKNTHYATSWGMCVPCGRHMKGCVECTGKHKCTKCDESSYKLGDEKDGKRECVGK